MSVLAVVALQFAERYMEDNAGHTGFRNADGAYLLAFALIMLNTDAHNPVAEGRLGKADFVNMCHQPLSEYYQRMVHQHESPATE